MPSFRGKRVTHKGYFSPPKGTPLSDESARIMDEKRMPDGGKEQPPNLDEYPTTLPQPNITPMTREQMSRLYGNEKHSLGTFPIPKDRIPKENQ